MMRVILTGGGTGGHIYPAIAIADKIKEKYPTSEILFVGTKTGMESIIVPKNGYDITFITVSGFNRKNMLKNVKTGVNLIKGHRQAKKIIKEFRPDAVIGTGGYVSAPVVRVAAKMGIPCYIHEQNAFPGATNKLLEKYVANVFLAFPEAEQYFKQKDKLVVTGNPVRSSFYAAHKMEARRQLSLPENDFIILSFGGSRGAKRLNEAVFSLIQFFGGKPSSYMVLATGSCYYAETQEKLKQKNIALQENIRIIEYIDDMPAYLAAADLVISRSGALTVSEIAVCGKPAILIPSPNVTGNHQLYNAQAMAAKGGAIVIEESELTDEKLLSYVISFVNDHSKLSTMAAGSKLVAPDDAAGKIAAHL